MPAGAVSPPGLASPAGFAAPGFRPWAPASPDAPQLAAGLTPYPLAAASVAGSGTTRTATVTTVTRPGDTILVLASGSTTTATVTAASDSQGNAYVLDGSFTSSAPSGFFLRCDGATGGPGGGPSAALGPGDTITVTTGAVSFTCLITGWCLPGAAPLDVMSAVFVGANAAQVTSSVTPAAGGELCVVGMLNQAGGGVPLVPPPYAPAGSAQPGGTNILTVAYQVARADSGGVAQSVRFRLADTVNSRGVQWAFQPRPRPPQVIQQSAPVRVRGAGPVALTLPGPTGTGNTVVVCTGTNGTAGNPLVSGVTLGGSADNFAQAVRLASASRNDSEIWFDPGAAAGQTAVSVSYAGGSGTLDEFAIAYEVAGVLAAGPAATAEAGPGTTWQVGPTAALGQPAGIAFGSLVNTGSVVPVPGDPANWTTIWNEAGTYAHLTGYDYLAYPAGTAAFAGTVPGGQYTGAVATFYAGAAPTAVPLAEVAGAAEQVGVAASVPAADAAAAADQLSVSAAASLADSGAGAETSAVAATVPLADAAGAVEGLQVSVSLATADTGAAGEALSVSGTVPLADAGAAADAPAVAATVSLADAVGAADAIGTVAGVSPALADAAGAAEALSVTVSLPLADKAAAADTASLAAAVPLTDAGSAVEAVDTSQRGIALADVAGAAETSQVSAAVPLAERGAAADTPAVSAAVGLTEAGAAAEQLGVSAAVPVGDAGAAAEAVAVAAGVGLADQAAGADAISTSAAGAPVLADAAGAVDALSVQVSTSLADAAAAADSLAAGVSAAAVGLADAAGAADSLTVQVSVPLAEAGAAADALAPPPAVAVNLADAGGVRDALSASVVTHAFDTGAASDILAIGRQITLSDAAAAADALIVTIPPSGPQPSFLAAPWQARWAVRPAAARLEVAPAASRWQAVGVPPRWACSAVPARWRIIVAAFKPIASVSVQNVNAVWTSDLAGDPVDPIAAGYPVSFAFPLSSGDQAHPAHPSGWLPGTWLAPLSHGYKGYIAQCPVGPPADGGLLQLAAGQSYDVWGEVDTGSEKVREFIGVQAVY